MADTSNSDRRLSESAEFPSYSRDTRSMSPAAPQDERIVTVGTEIESASHTAHVDPNTKALHEVVNSEIGIITLLNRLKQSIASAKEFAIFLKKRSVLEEEHSNGLKKLCKVTADSIRRPEHRHGSFLLAYEDITTIHERMAENGAQFAMSLHQMHEDLLEMAGNMERRRKQWKTTGLMAEHRGADTEATMRKSKAKYDGLAEDYDRARTGDRQGGKLFGLKGPKSAAQHEEDLLRKLQAADADYASKVQIAQTQRTELQSRSRPEAVKALQELIRECDSALTFQMQNFASLNEKLLLSNGLNISPLKEVEALNKPKSLREAILAIDNERDLKSYLLSFASQVPMRAPEIKYERNTVLNQSHLNTLTHHRQSDSSASYVSKQGLPQAFGAVQSPQAHVSPQFSQALPASTQKHERSFSHGHLAQGFSAGSTGGGPTTSGTVNSDYNGTSKTSNGPPQLSTLPFQTSHTPPPTLLTQSQSPTSYPTSTNQSSLPPLKPVFGLSLEQLFERDGSAVPIVVYQCIQAVALFGLEVEGIYRLSGTASHVNKLKAMFDNDASRVDFRDPANFFHDVNSVAGLLKQFFRDLPDPLLTTEHYAGFINAAKNDDDILRRDSLHAIINSLPDPNYATLRAVMLHLSRVQDNSSINRMNVSNLAIVFGPTLMGANTGPNIQDAGWQVKVVDTILLNCYQIFDDD